MPPFRRRLNRRPERDVSPGGTPLPPSPSIPNPSTPGYTPGSIFDDGDTGIGGLVPDTYNPMPGGPNQPPVPSGQNAEDDLLAWIRWLSDRGGPWAEGGYGSEVWNQVGPGGGRAAPEYGTTRDRMSDLMGESQYQTAMPESWMVRQMAAPQIEAQAAQTGRTLGELQRQSMEMGGPGVSGAALRQQALGQVGTGAAGAISGAQNQLFGAENQRRQTALNQAMGFAGQQGIAEYGAWADEMGQRRQLGGQMHSEWLPNMMEMWRLWMAGKALEEDGGEGPGRPEGRRRNRGW